MYAPVSLWRPLVSAALPVALPRGRMYAFIAKHHLTRHNFTSHARRSVYLRFHTFTLLPPNLASHESNITSHTHIHIRITSACASHIVQTASYTRYTYREHTTKVTRLYMHLHTCTQTHPPSPLHHSHTSSSLVAFLCSVQVWRSC